MKKILIVLSLSLSFLCSTLYTASARLETDEEAVAAQRAQIARIFEATQKCLRERKFVTREAFGPGEEGERDWKAYEERRLKLQKPTKAGSTTKKPSFTLKLTPRISKVDQEKRQLDYIKETTTFINALLYDLFKPGYFDHEDIQRTFEKYNIPLAIARYDDGSFSFRLDTNLLLSQFSPEEVAQKIGTMQDQIQKYHDIIKERNPKTERIRWGVGTIKRYGKDANEDYEMHGWKHPSHPTSPKRWEESRKLRWLDFHDESTLQKIRDLEEERKRLEREAFEKLNKLPDAERQALREQEKKAEKTLFEEMAKEGTKVERSSDKSRFFTLERMRRLYPDLFRK